MSIDCGIGRRQIVPRQPAAQSVEIGEEHAFVDVGLIQLVANFPFERRRDDDTTAEVRVPLQPVVHGRRRTRHQREQRELIQDASIDRRRLEKHQKGRPGERVEFPQRTERTEHLDRDGFRAFALHDAAKLRGELTVRFDEVHAPHRAVDVVFRRIFRREVKRDERRVRPVQQSRGKAAVLTECEPVPDRIGSEPLDVRVLPEVAEQRHLEAPRIGTAREPEQRAGHSVIRAAESTEREWRSKPAEGRIP